MKKYKRVATISCDFCRKEIEATHSPVKATVLMDEHEKRAEVEIAVFVPAGSKRKTPDICLACTSGAAARALNPDIP